MLFPDLGAVGVTKERLGLDTYNEPLCIYFYYLLFIICVQCVCGGGVVPAGKHVACTWGSEDSF